uniref:Uncharacterized protein n=1 Tax=Mycoplasma feriruminatoris TaxID=1179777 RepID=A0A654IE40_9MOLU|nr:hypothetical protein MF5292_00428 [Mycoplasma feriruminatoris]VZR75402.1 hypothetical protein MF5294_00430 [Mycoplasma feriruminatoris]VZR97652.1 hypothetical protein MF5293_00430 [Mycoplasma feriruminatoris]
MKKLLTLLTISTLLVIPTSTSFLINKDSNVTKVTYYSDNSNEVESKINDIWNKNFKDKLNSAKKFKWILEELKEKLKTNNLNSVDIKLGKETEQNNRFKFNTSGQKFVIKVDGKTISLEAGTVEKAWKAMKFRGKNNNNEDAWSKENEFDASNWNDQNFVVYELGYYDDGEQIRAIKLPHHVVSVPKELPKEITSLRELFQDATDFNDSNIKSWDTSNVEVMESMFEGASKFNQDLDQWNTKNVSNMSFMFREATAFNGKISNWNTSKVNTMSEMFKEAKNFNQDINTKITKNKNKYSSSWNVSNVNKMQAMFEGATSFNSDLSNWNTSNVTVMRDMFKNATSFNKDISNFDINKVQDFTNIFENATSFNKNISNWLVDDAQLKHFNNKVDDWKSYHKPQSRKQVLKDLEKQLEKSNASYIKTTNLLYDEEITKLIEKHNIDTEKQKIESRITDIWNNDFKNKLDSAKKFKWILEDIKDKLKKEGLLKASEIKLLDSSQEKNRFKFDKSDQKFVIKVNDKQLSLEVGKVSRAWKPVVFKGKTNGERASSKETEWDISYWDDKDFEVYEIGYYDNGSEIQAIKLPKGVAIVPTKLPKEITSTKDMFAYSYQFNDKNIKQWDMSNVENMSGMFLGTDKFNQDLDSWNVSSVKNMNQMFLNAKEFNGKIGSWNVENVTDMSSMFLNAIAFNQDLSNWKVDNVKNMNSMFLGATNFNQNLNQWNVENVTDISYMFKNAISFNENITSWKPKNVISMSNMFEGATKFDQDISKWEVSNVKNMQDMFKNAKTFNKNLADWDVSKVSNMHGMFELADKFNGDISKWDTKNVESMSSMFKGATSFNKDISNWNTSKVKDMSYMFSDAINFNQNINTKVKPNKEKTWDVSNVKDMESMFDGAEKFNSELSKWDTSHATNMAKMFKNTKTFNQNIANFNIKNVMFFNNMFENAVSFNQDLSKWSFKHLGDKIKTNTESYDLNARSWTNSWKPDANSTKPVMPQPQPAPKPVEPTPIPPVQPAPSTPETMPTPQPKPVPVEPTPTPPVQPQPAPDKPFIRPLIPIRPINPNDNKITLSEIIKKDQLGEINFRSANEILKKLASLNKDINIYELVVTNITKNLAIVSARLDSDYIGSVLVSFNIKKPQAIKWEKPIFNTTDDWFLYPVISNNKNIIDPVKPEKPTKPIKPDKPNKPTNPSNPITPNKPDKPADNKPTTPTTPTNNKKPEAKKVNNNKAAFIGIGVTLLAIILISSVALILKRKKK